MEDAKEFDTRIWIAAVAVGEFESVRSAAFSTERTLI